MESIAKSDLLSTLESQREKIHKYETKLKDLVAAYKSQVQENDTLRATLKAQQNASAAKIKSSTAEESAEGGTESASMENNKRLEKEVICQGEQIDSLTQSVTDLMEQKKSQQAAALAERKIIKASYDEKIQQLEQDIGSYKDQLNTAQQQIQEIRKKLRAEQIERDHEQSDQAVMMRELQKKLAEHMTQKEDMLHQLEDMKKEVLITHQQPDTSELHEHMIADLTNQLQEMRERMKAGENANQTSPMLLELKKEITGVQAQHARNIRREQVRADEAERKMHSLASKSEDRISELESKVTQFSEMVGNYERLRFTDQQAISKLKERVTQLDQENTALAKVAHPLPDESNMAIEEIVDRMRQLKTSLRDACDQSSDHLNYEDFLYDLLLSESRLHWKCEEEYSQLKEEFERYKLRAQSVLKNKSSKDGGSNKEMDGLKNTITELRERLRAMAERNSDELNRSQQTVQELRDSISNLHAVHKQELSAVKCDYQQQIADIEKRLHLHRDRTISLLAEKDREIEHLKGKPNHQRSTSTPTSPLGAHFKEQLPDADSPVEQLFTQDTKSAPLLHYAQESARSNQEIATLRRQKHELETALHDMQESASDRQQQSEDQVALLKAEIKRLDRNQCREGLNLEYLKNVIYQFMVCSDLLGKQHIFNAIATILHFSPQEKKQVTDLLTSTSSTYMLAMSSKR